MYINLTNDLYKNYVCYELGAAVGVGADAPDIIPNNIDHIMYNNTEYILVQCRMLVAQVENF